MSVSRREFLKLSSASATAAAFLSQLGHINPALAQDAVRITFGGWGGVAEDEGVKAAIEVFEAENEGINVEWQHTPSATEYSRVTLTNIAAGTAPDTSFIRSDDYTTLASGGVLLDITDHVKNDPLLGQPITSSSRKNPTAARSMGAGMASAPPGWRTISTTMPNSSMKRG